MAWVRLDDQLHTHPKIRAAWHADPRALGLHLLALSYVGAHLTDGLVDETFVAERIPVPRQRDHAVAALVDAGLWERNGSGWQIHDFLDYNQSRERVLTRRRKDAARKRLG